MVAHNCPFDWARIIKAVENYSLRSAFEECVIGFTDTLPIFKTVFPNRKDKAAYKLTSLAKDILSHNCDGAHNARIDIEIPQELVVKNVTVPVILENKVSASQVIDKLEQSKKSKINIASLQPLKTVISQEMLKRLTDFNIDYKMLCEAYKCNGEEGAVFLLKGVKNGKA